MLVTFSQNRSQQKLLRIGNALIDTAKKRARCSATVILNGHNEFKKGRRNHNHEVDNFNRARRELYRGDTKRVEIIRSNCKGETVIERN